MIHCFSTLLLLPVLFAQERQPLGLILEAREARVLRAGAELALTARNGDLLFAGDSVSVEGGAMRLLFCPEKVDLMLQAPAEVAVRERALRIRADRSPVRKSVDNCLLPILDRVAASQQHYGESLIRALEPPGTTASPGPSRVEALPDAERTALRRELEPIDQALAADPKDAAARVARLAGSARNTGSAANFWWSTRNSPTNGPRLPGCEAGFSCIRRRRDNPARRCVRRPVRERPMRCW